MFLALFLVVAAAVVFLDDVQGLQFTVKSIEGTETIDGLTDKQLAIQRWFADLTFLREDVNDWKNWGNSVKDLDCDGNTCIRYEIAGLAYAAAVLGLKMPEYQQVTEAIMYNSIVRMTQQVVWQYVELFDDFKSQSTYPDPVAYKNIMYSGHLVQMIAMFEAIFGNQTFSIDGWDFMWTDPQTKEVKKIHYTTSLLMDRVYQQSIAYGNGGVPCEPDSIFVICNNYPQNGWLLADKMYGTSYTEKSIPSWHRTLKTHAINRLNKSDELLENYFKLDYLIKPLGIWEPIGTIGSDMWALSWMKTWWPALDIRSSLQPAFEHIRDSSCWIVERNESTNSTTARLHPDDRKQKIFPFDEMVTTSFYPLIERQFLSLDQSTALARYTGVLSFFEESFGQSLDLDGDGVYDAYQYNSLACSGLDCESGDYSVWSTANLLIGMIHPADDLDFLRSFFQQRELSSFRKQNNQSRIDSVEYPDVMVSFARYSTSLVSQRHHNLTVHLKPGDHAPINRDHLVVFGQIPRDHVDQLVIFVNGVISKRFEVVGESEDSPFVSIRLQVRGWTQATAASSQQIKIEAIY